VHGVTAHGLPLSKDQVLLHQVVQDADILDARISSSK